MTLAMTETQRLKGVPTTYRNCIKDFFDNVLPGLTHWSPGIKLGTTAGQQGGTFTRDVDGMEGAIYNFITGDPIGTGSTGNPGGGSSGDYMSATSSAHHTAFNGIIGAAINKGPAYFNAAANFMGTNGITAVFFDTAGRTGYFLRGETLSIGGGTYEAPIIEVFHDSNNSGGGCIIIGAWTTGTPTSIQLSGLALAGLTSGATATALTFIVDRAPSLLWYHLKAQDTFYLSNVTGAAPTGVVTGATTGFTATVSTWTPASGGKLVVTGGNGRWLHGESVTWAGGSANIEHVPFGCEMASVLSSSIPNANEADCQGYLVLEDADRLALLMPNEGSGPTTYQILAFGKWAENLQGFGQCDCVINAYSNSGFPISNAQLPFGIVIDPRDESPVTISANNNFIPTDALMGGAPAYATAIMPASRPTAGSQQDLAYDAGQAGGTVPFALPGHEGRRIDRFYHGRVGTVTRPEFVLLGFFIGPTPSGFKTTLSNPDGSNYGLQLDSGTNALFLDYTGITP